MTADTIQRRVRDLVRNDDPAALEVLHDAFAPALFAFLLSRLRNRTDAEDALQHLFLDLARRPRQLLAARDLEPWIFTKARNLSTDRLRLRAREAGHSAALADRPLPDWMDMAPRAGPATADDAALADAVDRLPDEQREVVVLKAFEGLTFADIAARTGVSFNTAASRWRYALEKLRVRLAGESRHEP
ncbi:MAG: sigma-70 family RNA polymerase sigma factor [Verrucomicrobia bacterium]|nr:sigma-70 family RNA polymerase sigma factor [Verrucomicrobiota bacterium]